MFQTLTLLALASSALASPYLPRAAAPTAPKAVYFLSNEDQNSVIGLAADKNGMLSAPSVSLTGGKGLVFNNATAPGGPLFSDSLLSQSSLFILEDVIFAVNAGDDTISMLQIDAKNPTKLKPIGAPAKSSGGKAPNSVTASSKLGQVCAAYTGSMNGVSCAPFDKTKGIGAFDQLRPLGQNQTDPPTGPPHTASHVFFSGDETHLFTTVKGTPKVDGDVGFLASWEVIVNGTISPGAPLTVKPKDGHVLFGATNIPNTKRVLVTDATFGAMVVKPRVVPAVSNDPGRMELKARQFSTFNVTGQRAICWSTISTFTNTGFISDAGQNSIVEVDYNRGKIVTNYKNPVPEGFVSGFLDLRASGNFVYALNAGLGTNPGFVVVLDLTLGSGKAVTVQSFPLANITGVTPGKPMGMVTLNSA